MTPDVPPARVSAPRVPELPPSDMVHDTPRVSAPSAPSARASAEAALADAAPVFRQADAGPSRSRTGMIVAAIVVIAAAAAAFFLFGRGKGTPAVAADSTPPAAAPDSARAPQAAAPDTTTPAAPAVAAAARGFLRVFGDLPDDVVIWVDSTQRRGRVIELAPGSYNLEIETAEFEAWERRVTVRAGDTTRVRVELELKADSTQQ